MRTTKLTSPAYRRRARLPLAGVLATLVALLLLGGPSQLRAQDLQDYYASMLEEEVEVVNPAKYPMLGFFAGVTNLFGEIRNPVNNFYNSSWGGKFNLAIPVGREKQLRINIGLALGQLKGEDYARSIQLNQETVGVVKEATWYPNTSFTTMFYQVGLNVEYNFWHLTGTAKTVNPFISFGAGVFIFSPKGNYTNDAGEYYHYWADGSIRMKPEYDEFGKLVPYAPADIPVPVIKDNNYETDLKKSNIWGLNNVPTVSVVFPLEVGVDFKVSDRIALRVATSLNYVLSDMVDGMDTKIAALYPGMTASKIHDMFLLTTVGLTIDPFSQAESFIVDRVFADIDNYDYDIVNADQDGDGVWDQFDECPDTPRDVVVDSVGCPIDSDRDGVPDYLDKEPNTPLGRPVDAEGVTLTDKGMTLPVGEGEAVLRKDVKLQPVSPLWSKRYDFTGEGIPEKFRDADLDGDGIISYEEVVRAVDDFFTGNSQLEASDIYELNAYFFSQ